MNHSAYVVTVALGLWGGLNLVATYFVRQGNEFAHHKAVRIISVWIVPFFGALMVILQAVGKARQNKYENRSREALPSGFLLEDAPEQISVGVSENISVISLMSVVNGFPLMDWPALQKLFDKSESREISKAIKAEVQKAWLLHLRDALGDNYLLFEGKDAFVLSPLAPSLVTATANFISSAQARILSILGGEIAQQDSDEKVVFIVFADEETYYNYVACYYPDDGEFSFSAGLFIKSGIKHFVSKADQLTEMEPIIAHELTHCALSHLGLPVWLDEGLAVNTEHLVIGGTRYMRYTMNQLRDMHDSFWGGEEIQEFWAGGSFFRPDRGSMLSYELARILVEQMNKDWPAFVDFVCHAKINDAGAAASKEYLGVDLGEYVCALLEKPQPDAWGPNPSQWGEARVE